MLPEQIRVELQEIMTLKIPRVTLLLLMIIQLLMEGYVTASAAASLQYRVVSVPFDESIQVIFRQRAEYIDVSWTRTHQGRISHPKPLYSVFIEHRGVRDPGFLNRKYREYNVKIMDKRPDGRYKVFQRADGVSVRDVLTEHITRLADLCGYPERNIILMSKGVVLFLYELTGEVPRMNFHIFKNGAER